MPTQPLLPLLLFLLSILCPSSSQPHHFLKPTTPLYPHLAGPTTGPRQYIELTQPLPSDHLTPSCTHVILRHTFANTMGQPPTSVPYSPPSHCPSPWSHVVLELDAASRGDQYDRVAAVWLDGAEILRTSTPEPTESGIFWKVRRDVTRYSSVLSKSNVTVFMMLENLVNDVFTGAYHVNLSLLFYYEKGVDDIAGDVRVSAEGGGLVRKLRGLDNEKETPADLVFPVCDREGERGFWFRIEKPSDVGTVEVRIPMNARRVVLELYVSAHGNDEFWYSNPPYVYIEMNRLSMKRGNGAFREVFVRIDGVLVASDIPVPVVFTGGINPLSWEPVVGIGAFELPSRDFELTPFLGSLLDGMTHRIEIGVANAIQFWLLDANLLVWLDSGSSGSEAKMVVHQPPEIHQLWNWEFQQLDGFFSIEAESRSMSSGWVATSCGNLTTSVVRGIKFKNSINFERNGTYKKVHQKAMMKEEVRVESEMGELLLITKLHRRFPLVVITSTVPGLEKDTYLMTTNVSHSVEEKLISEGVATSLLNMQESEGWILVKDHDVLSGAADTTQSFRYQDVSSCYSRNVEAAGGQLLKDDTTTVCPLSLLNNWADKLSIILQFK